MRVSVVIPCYNCEKYIQETLERLCRQTQLPDEIICVDDGSKDRTADIIKEFSTNHDVTVKLISQPNSGVSVARNNGIEHASGDVLLFLDADDAFSECFIEMVLMKFSDEYDCVYGYFSHDYEQLNQDAGTLNPTPRDKITAFEDFTYNKDRCHTSAFAYRKDIIDTFNIRFTPKAHYGEDWEFTTKYLDCTSNIICLNAVVMFYRQSDTSAMKRVTYKHIDAVHAAERAEEFLLGRNSECYQMFAKYMKHRAIFSVAHTFAKFHAKDYFEQFSKEYPVKNSMRMLVSNDKISIKIRAVACAYILSKRFFYFISQWR